MIHTFNEDKTSDGHVLIFEVSFRFVSLTIQNDVKPNNVFKKRCEKLKTTKIAFKKIKTTLAPF